MQGDRWCSVPRNGQCRGARRRLPRCDPRGCHSPSRGWEKALGSRRLKHHSSAPDGNAALLPWSPSSSPALPERLTASARKTFLGLGGSRAGWETISLPLTKIAIEFVFFFFLFLLASLGALTKPVKRGGKILQKKMRERARLRKFSVFLEQSPVDPTCKALSV